MNPLLIRPQALEKATDPDQLDQTLRVVRPQHFIAFVLVAAIVVLGLLWSIVATAPVYVQGQGLLRSAHGVTRLSTQDAAYVEEILLQPGAHVEKGQAIAYLSLPQRAAELGAAKQAAAEAEREVQRLEQKGKWQTEHQQPLDQALRESLQERIKALQTQLDKLKQMAEANAKVLDADVIRLQSLQAELQTNIAAARDELLQLDQARQKARFEHQQALLQARNKAEALKQHAETLQQAYQQRRQLTASGDGVLDELKISVNDVIAPGQPLARLLIGDPTDHTLSAIVFVPAAQGQKIQQGMPTRIALAGVKTDLHGYLQGEISRVAELPASRASLMRRLQNQALADQILQAGAAIEVEIALHANPTTSSGYAWTSGKGPDMRIETGSLALADITVERDPIIGLIFPALGALLGSMGDS